MLRNRKTMGIMIAMIIIVISSSAWGLDSLIINIDRANVIRNPDDNNDSRIILQFDMPEVLDTNTVVTFAELRFVINPNLQIDHPVKFYVHPISTNWDIQNADWHRPWVRAGGDFPDSIRSLGHLLQSEETELKIEVSRLIQTLVRNDLSNNGFIVRQQGLQMSPFSLLRRYSNNCFAQLAIYYAVLRLDE